MDESLTSCCSGQFEYYAGITDIVYQVTDPTPYKIFSLLLTEKNY